MTGGGLSRCRRLLRRVRTLVPGLERLGELFLWNPTDLSVGVLHADFAGPLRRRARLFLVMAGGYLKWLLLNVNN